MGVLRDERADWPDHNSRKLVYDLEAEEEQDYGTEYAYPRCPRCQSKNIVLRGGAKPEIEGLQTKYHLCRDCGLKYKAIWK